MAVMSVMRTMTNIMYIIMFPNRIKMSDGSGLPDSSII